MHTCDCFQVALSLGFLVDRTPEGSYKKYILIQLSSAGGMVLMLIGECNVQFCNTQETQPTQPKIHPGFLSLSWTLTGWFLVGPAQMPGSPKIVVMSCILPWILCRYMMCCNVLVYVLYYAVTCCVYVSKFLLVCPFFGHYHYAPTHRFRQFNESTIDQVDSISAMEHSLAVVL